MNQTWYFSFANINTTFSFAATVAATLKDCFEGESTQSCLCGGLYGEKFYCSSLPRCVVRKIHVLYRNWGSNDRKHPHSFQLVVNRETSRVYMWFHRHICMTFQCPKQPFSFTPNSYAELLQNQDYLCSTPQTLNKPQQLQQGNDTKVFFVCFNKEVDN